MKAFLKQIFKDTNEKQFSKYSPYLSLFADIILIYYIKVVMLPRFMQKEKIYALLVKSNPQVQYLSVEEFDNLIAIFQSTFMLTFTIIIAFNALMYVLAARGKRMGIKFVYGYTFSTFILSAVELIASIFVLSVPFSWGTLITMFLYLYVYLGMRHFKTMQKLKKSSAR